MALRAALSSAFAPVVDLVFPPRCPLCGAGLAAQAGLCVDCWGALAIPGAPRCSACQRPFGPGHLEQGHGQGPGPGSGPGQGEDAAGLLCAPCLANPPRHDGIAAGTLYDDGSRKLVLAFKHGRRIALAPMLARIIAVQLPLEIGADWLFVPVPLHRWRLWRRGFNQAALLAGQLATLRGSELGVDVLQRRKPTPMLGGLGRLARARALSGAISLDSRWRDRIKGRSVVLVDDVLTSGATSDACVSALKRAEASQVVIACFARVLD